MHSTDALPLPPRPDVSQYRKLAKDLLAAVETDDADKIADWSRRWFRNLMRLHGEPHHPELVGWGEGFASRMAAYWRGEPVEKRMPPPRRTLAGAQLVLARVHGFPSWPALVKHIEEQRSTDSEVGRFEAAVDAIVDGNVDRLSRLLREHPELVRATSTRGHGATLLHYVSANGVEGYRQKTPPNIVEITRLLLAAGADVNAKAECYGGGDTVLGLSATSLHPANAGVMIPLLETLVEAGADVNSRDGGWGLVRSAIANGQPEAAHWLAEHGATLELHEAAGTGRLDVVRSFVADDGTLQNGATPAQLRTAFEWAVGYGHRDVVDFLLARGMDPAAVTDEGATALHWAAYGGHQDLVDLLIERGVPVNHRERTHGGTPIEWALYAWGSGDADEPTDPRYYGVVASLARAGGTLAPSWLDENMPRSRVARRIRADPRMQVALEGRTSG